MATGAEGVDQVVLGAGLFGLYGADLATRAGYTTVVIDPDPVPLSRASFANQARIHLGYHYPRSIGTALQSIAYHDRFTRDFALCVNDRFTKVYAVARFETLTSAGGFERFCENVGIPAERTDPNRWFRPGTIEEAFVCTEASFDARSIRAEMERRLADRQGLRWHLGQRVANVDRDADEWRLTLEDGRVLRTGRVLNATYASINQVLRQFGFDPLPVTYELCELVLGRPSPALEPFGLTVMDGPFFSVMPFGTSGMHSLSAVDYTPHYRSAEPLPTFPCQARSPTCRPDRLDNCLTCPVRPGTLGPEMLQLACRYLRDELTLDPASSVLAVRPVLSLSRVDDSRPTLVYRHATGPELVSILSGKINTIYDLEPLWTPSPEITVP
jgi:hypothetical protein